MTAETLKPFITPTSAENYVTTHSSAAVSSGHRRSCYFLAITASVITVILTAALLGIAIWNTMRISNLQTEVQSLNRVIESMQKRLGLTYLDDLSDLEKEDDENNNALIDDVLPDADVGHDDNDHENLSRDDADDDEDEDDNDDDDDDYEDYEELMNKFRHYQETEEEEDETDSIDSLGDDNLYEDFEKYNDSKRKHHGERKTRSVIALNNENENLELKSHNEQSTILRKLKSSHPKSIVTEENFERRRSPLRKHLSRRRKFPLVKSAKSVAAPITPNPIDEKPAAHFHISHTIPYHKHRLQISNHNGDVYIGKPSLTNEMNVEKYFYVEHGVITVIEPGLYYVYAQICYNNSFPKNGFTIFHGNKEFLQCLHNSHTKNVSLINTCHTSGLIYLRPNEQIHIRDFHSNRLTFLSERSDRSYFGLIKV